jgi:hypothetical protein
MKILVIRLLRASSQLRANDCALAHVTSGHTCPTVLHGGHPDVMRVDSSTEFAARLRSPPIISSPAEFA